MAFRTPFGGSLNHSVGHRTDSVEDNILRPIHATSRAFQRNTPGPLSWTTCIIVVYIVLQLDIRFRFVRDIKIRHEFQILDLTCEPFNVTDNLKRLSYRCL